MKLELIGVSVARGGKLAVRNVAFEARAGAWLGVVGANGSGKTSLLRALAGRLELASGHILIDGIDRSSDRAWRARNVGFAPEAATLPGRLHVFQLFGLLADKSPGVSQLATMAPLRTALGIDDLLERRIDTLSSGNRQRIALYTAFLTPVPRCAVILDEPFNWLDPVCAYELKLVLSEMVAQGLTLVTALHDLASWALLCDHGILLTDGEVAADLSAAELNLGRHDLATFERGMIEKLRARSN